MPELPEVENICLSLKKDIVGKKILNATNYRKNLRIDFPCDFSSILNNRYITSVTRRAKYIRIYMNDLILIIHLGMSGRLIYHNNILQELLKHDHAEIVLNEGKLVFNDPRRFGLITITNIHEIDNHVLFKNLGSEPLSSRFNQEYLSAKLASKNIAIKLALMDNKIVVGIGNIYASEALYRAGILPRRPSSSLGKLEITRLVASIRETLYEAINAGGSSLKDYVNLSGEAGYFQNSFRVYDRENQNCMRCSSVIKKIKQAGRATYFCISCQK